MSARITEAMVEAALKALLRRGVGRDLTLYDVRSALAAGLSTEPGEAEEWRDIPVTDETLDYVSKYGGRCRDCADNFGVCPGGLPCNYEARRAAIRHVLRAINYGMTHGYLPAAPLPEDTHHGR